eukprot:3211565-Amphidinium_carterae.1
MPSFSDSTSLSPPYTRTWSSATYITTATTHIYAYTDHNHGALLVDQHGHLQHSHHLQQSTMELHTAVSAYAPLPFSSVLRSRRSLDVLTFVDHTSVCTRLSPCATIGPSSALAVAIPSSSLSMSSLSSPTPTLIGVNVEVNSSNSTPNDSAQNLVPNWTRPTSEPIQSQHRSGATMSHPRQSRQFNYAIPEECLTVENKSLILPVCETTHEMTDETI